MYMARALRMFVFLIFLCTTNIVLPARAQSDKNIRPSSTGGGVSLAQSTELEVQRLTAEVNQARESEDCWETASNLALWLAAFVGIAIAVSAIGSGRTKNRLIGLQDSLAKAKETQLALVLQEGEEKLESERKARIELEEEYAPRRISAPERKRLASRLKPFAGQIVSTWFHAGDHEGFVFASDIASALSDAHWDVYAPASILDLAESGRRGTTTIPTGVTVSSTPDETSRNASDAIVRELLALGFDAQKSPATDRKDAPVVTVTVESRPEGAQGEAKLRKTRK